MIGIGYNINICLCQVQYSIGDERELINIDDNFVNDNLLRDLDGTEPYDTNVLNEDILKDISKTKDDRYFFIKSRSKRDNGRISERNRKKFRPSPLLCG